MSAAVVTDTDRLRSAVPPLAVAGVAAAGCLGLALWNPGDHGTPLCPTKAMFNVDCPFCGGLRAVATMTRGHPLVSADHNVLLVALAPFVAVWWVMWMWSSWTDRPMPASPVRFRTIAIVLGVVAVAFTVVRNVQPGRWGTWLASGASA
jgi:hypothetical protein